MSTNQPLIRFDRVSKIYGEDDVETVALADVSVGIHRGEYVAITGPSGCGKSTMLAIIGLLDTPTSGDYWLDGKLVADLSASELARLRNLEIGLIFQSFNLIGDMTVFENVEYPLVCRNVKGAERQTRVQAALERVGMARRARHRPGQLSGGERQLVAIARAIVGKPLVLLADEPTGNLDSTSGASLMQMLRELHAGGATICLATHDERYVREAQRAIRLFDGRVP